MIKKESIKLNINFKNDKIICARSPELCINCIYQYNCETLNVFYNKYSHKDILECFNNSEKRR